MPIQFTSRTQKIFATVKKVALYIFAAIGLVFTFVFIGLHLGFLNIHGTIAERNSFFNGITSAELNQGSNSTELNAYVLCQSNVIAQVSEKSGEMVDSVWETNHNITLTEDMIEAMVGALSNSTSIQSSLNACQNASSPVAATSTMAIFPWTETPEWSVITGGLIKDAPIITQVSQETGVSSRLIISNVIPEQFRFFTSDRDAYKQYFEPLKILGTLSQFSLGVSGIKPETATEIENNLSDPTSPFYLGPQYAQLLAYPAGSDHDSTLYNRLTDSTNHYYQYLYTALFIKEVMNQWKIAGIDLTYRPDIIVTLFNLGFEKSSPNPNPTVGGAPITIGNETLSFGELGYQFYFSGELSDTFPY